jgi:la-related protein 1
LCSLAAQLQSSEMVNQQAAGYGVLRPRDHNKIPAPIAAMPAAAQAGAGAGAVLLQADTTDEAPEHRRALKVICEKIAAAERDGGYEAACLAFEAVSDGIPPALGWKVHMELAECAKRSAQLEQVKYHLARSLNPPPKASQLWLETCRTLEELGELEECRDLLLRSLDCCPANEQLALKLVRILERLGDLASLRGLVGSLRQEPLERVCKVFVEAAHAEVRAGNIDAARGIFSALLSRMPHHGPIFCEACQLEAMLGNWQAALRIAENGVQSCMKHGPLWFAIVHFAEKVTGARAAQEYASMALNNTSQELHWKFHFEVAAAFSREGDVQSSRQCVALAALSCPKHLRWKVWLLASRTELWDGSTEACRKLLDRAEADAPAKMQALVCIEQSRCEEFLGNRQKSRAALTKALALEGHDWKVCLESIFMEMREGSLEGAHKAALTALDVQPAFGRLWSALATVEHSVENGVEAAMVTCRKASQEVPKSGEVWCEFARVFMNPSVESFNLDRARKCLEFAVRLTPQYGDSFLEFLRLQFLLEIRRRLLDDPVAAGWLSAPKPASHSDNDRLEVVALVAQRVEDNISKELAGGSFHFSNATATDKDKDAEMPAVQMDKLDVLCEYADPNYGFLWFWSRQGALSSPREVLRKMHEDIMDELLNGGSLWAYTWAVACGVFGLAAGSTTPNLPDRETSKLSSQDFVLGSMKLSRCFAYGSANLNPEERWRLIFGSDILCA